jgi:hypothetical protein
VYAGHGFAINHRYIVASAEGVPDVTRFGRVTAAATRETTTLTLDSTVNLVQGEYLFNLGTDSGTSSPNYDGSPIGMFVGPRDDTTQMTEAVVGAQGAYAYWTRGEEIWELLFNSSGTPVLVAVDIFAGSRRARAHIEPTVASTGVDFILDQGLNNPDKFYTSGKRDDNTPGFVELGDASSAI